MAGQVRGALSPYIGLPKEALAKFILGWWHRLSSLCKCVLKVGAALTYSL
jgi:hypothetical protein